MSMNMTFHRKLTIPMELKALCPLSPAGAETVRARTEELRAILRGEDPRLLLVIGPCSADREDAVLDYISRLCRVREQVADRLCIVPRLYTGKPRSAGEGYMGPLHQPDPVGRPDLLYGILATRRMHLRAVEELGMPSADEMLYPENLKYLDDLLAYVTVGARSVEDQQHRLTASGLDTPVGMKNPIGGDLSGMMHAIHAAQQPHTFLYRGWEAESGGNPYAHAILRGYTDREGGTHPNYGAEELRRLAALYEGSELKNPAVLVDCSHANSGKDPFRQQDVLRAVLNARREDPALERLVRGFLVESYLVDGAQPVGGGCYGQSITDPCLGWEKSERLIYALAEAL